MKKASMAVLAVLVAGSAGALEFGKVGVQVDLSEVYLSRTVTVSFDLVDDGGDGSNSIFSEVKPDPEGLVKLLSFDSPPSFGCTGTGTSAGRWVFKAVAPGDVRFMVSSAILTCTQSVDAKVEKETKPVTIKPVPVWSDVVVSPAYLDVHERVEVRLKLRNDCDKLVTFSAPQAQEELRFRGRQIVIPTGEEMKVDPPEAAIDGGIALPPGRVVTVTWPFKTIEHGVVKFRVIGAGLLITSPPATVRGRGQLWIGSEDPKLRSAEGEVVDIEGSVHNVGDYIGLRDIGIGMSASPPEAVELLGTSLSSTAVMGANTSIGVSYRLRLLKAGPLALTLTAFGREVDTGNTVAAEPASISIDVQPPPSIGLRMTPSAATVFVGENVRFELEATNRGRTGSQEMGPLVVSRRGEISVLPLRPLFQAVSAGATAVFTGGFVVKEAGVTEIVAQVTTRGEKGGHRMTATSDPVQVRVVSRPRFSFVSGQERSYSGGTENLKFTIRNDLGVPVSVRDVRVHLSGAEGDGIARPGSAAEKTMAPGAVVEYTVEAALPAAKAPYPVTGVIQVSGTGPYGLPFDVRMDTRRLTIAGPKESGLTLVEPSPEFQPPLDPLMQIEWTLTSPGRVGLTVVGSEGEVRSVIVPLREHEAGFHSALWMGTDSSRRLLPPGKYTIRLSGPPSSTIVGSPGSAAGWKSDRAIEITDK